MKNIKEIKDKIVELTAKKEEAVKQGQYPYAAQIRDQIRHLENQLKESGSN